MSNEYKVTFQPSGRTVYVLPDTILFEAAARAGLLLQSPCGGNGTCGKCRVRITDGDCPPSEACRRVLGAEAVENGQRLACQAKVRDHCVVEIPASSLFESTSKILTAGRAHRVRVNPTVRKQYVRLAEPTSEDPASDLKRLEREIGPVHVHLDVLRSFPENLRRDSFSGTAVVCADRLVAFEPGDTTGACCGVAFDLGTTTIVAVLMDLRTGEERGVAACMNPQVSYGDDVISRILRVQEDPDSLQNMQREVVAAMNELIARLMAEQDDEPCSVYEATVAGNTTMQHLCCGISPRALGELPFPPALNRGLMLQAREIGLDIHPNGRLYVFPNIGGFVGGDTVSGILATALDQAEDPVLLIDIGTNGEIVLAHKGHIWATSTAAGPAFEGARIQAGMRASDGAIEKVVRRDGDIWYNVIGNTAPAGICGTALIDLAAEMLRFGVLESTGRIVTADEAPGTVEAPLRARLHEDGDHVNFLLADASESKTGEPVTLYQRDIRELQLATGAIRAGVTIMLQRAGLEPDDLAEVCLAGAFGNFIRRSNARRIGLLPAVPTSKIRFVGNAASIGAKAVLLNREAREAAERIAGRAEHVDLSLDPEFQMQFGMSMMFPENEGAKA